MPAVDWNLLQRITTDSLRVYEAVHRAQKMSDETERLLRLVEDLLRQAALAYLTDQEIRIPLPKIKHRRNPNERTKIPPTDRCPAPLL